MNTIKVKKYSDVIEEFVAAGTITPGMLVELDTTGEVKAHSNEDGNVLPMFALEDELQGKTIDDNYVATDLVQVWIPYRGDQVNAILAAGENVSIGTFLTSDGEGKLHAAPALTSTGDAPLQIVGVATEAVNAASADARIIIRIV
jgi:hypothetical protein